MEDDESFTTVLTGMQALSTKRDPRSVRLAAVTAAMIDVVGDEVSPAKVYASTVSALEGTLQQGATDSLATQVALLELLRTTVPHVSSAAIGATLSVTSRILRGVVASSQEVTEMETRDELGGINATLRAVVRASAEVLKRMPLAAPEKAVKHLYHGTILTLFEDRRPKVRKAAHSATCELLMKDTCHPAVIQSVESYAHLRLEKARKDANAENVHLLHLLSFLERAIVHVDSKMGASVTELLMAMLQTDSNPSDFVASISRKDVTSKVMLVNGLLSTLVAVLEHDDPSRNEAYNAFAARVLASLLQARPMILFGSGSCDTDLIDSGRTLYGRVLLLSCQRVLQSNPKVGCKLFPLVIQMILQLSRPSDEAPAVEVAQTLMVELTRTFRVHLSPMVEKEPRSSELDMCLGDSLRGMEQVLKHSFRPTWSVTLQALAFLLHLMQDDDKVPRVVESLIQLHTHVATDAAARAAVESAVGSLIQGVGIEAFWEWVTWKEPIDAAKRDSKKRQSKQVEGGQFVVVCLFRWILFLMSTTHLHASILLLSDKLRESVALAAAKDVVHGCVATQAASCLFPTAHLGAG